MKGAPNWQNDTSWILILKRCTRRTFAFRAINIKPDIITNFCVVILLAIHWAAAVALDYLILIACLPIPELVNCNDFIGFFLGNTMATRCSRTKIKNHSQIVCECCVCVCFFSKVEIANTEGVFVIAVKDNQSTTKIFGKCKYSTTRNTAAAELVIWSVMVKPWFSTTIEDENGIAAVRR